jgi:hypothetical protein
MQTNFVPTNLSYHRILDAPDAAARRQVYLEELVQPWQAMFEMFGARFGGGGAQDPMDGPRGWAWLMPDQTETMAALLEPLEAADAWRAGGEALARAAGCFDPYASRLPFDAITGWLVLGDPARANPLESGYTGAVDWTQPRFIGQFWAPDVDNLARLPGLVAHEMHHLIRLRAFPFGPHTSVADYIVIEGTAEAFAASLFGEDIVGAYAGGLEGADFDTARRLIGQGLGATGFDVIRGYIFGDGLAERGGFQPVGGMPDYGGYAIGYHLVQAYLARTGTTIEAATFLPAMEIIEGSGFFASLKVSFDLTVRPHG